MTAVLNSKLDHPAYHKPIQLPKYNGLVTVFQAVSSNDGAKVLSHANPAWSQADHYTLASLHQIEAARQKMRHSQLLDEAANETYGRPFQVSDYRISAIGSDAFSDGAKTALRRAAHAATNHQAIARAHMSASRRRTASV